MRWCAGRSASGSGLLAWLSLSGKAALPALLLSSFLIATASGADNAHNRQSDEEIRKAIIRESIASYPGSCPCPYNVARNGSHCGRRSAYSRPGGRSPLCYPNDVSDEMVAGYRKRHAR